jgi:upstream activation factor subunit UAF30
MSSGSDVEATATAAAEERPTPAELKVVIRRLIPKVNLQKTGVKAFIKLLSKECGGLDLKHRSDYIKQELSEAINEMEGTSDEEDGGDDEEEDETANANASPKKKRGAGKGLSIKKEISDKLATFLGQGKEMARTDIVKALWEYIKEHDLQNPENKREILLDTKMHTVFGVENFTMFTMNKYIAAHIHPYKPVDLTPKEPKPRKKRKANRKANDPPIKKKRKAKKPGLQPPYRLSPELATVVGKPILPRPQVVTALWAYIKDNKLQVRTNDQIKFFVAQFSLPPPPPFFSSFYCYLLISYLFVLVHFKIYILYRIPRTSEKSCAT